MAEYEFWLTDDTGRRMALLTSLAFASYTRSIIGLGTINIGMPFEPFNRDFKPYFRPDWRVEVWRSPKAATPLRMENIYLLRKPHVYVRDDGMKILQFYGRSGLDLLYRRSVIQEPSTIYTTKTDYADDMMKEIVRQQMLYGSALDEDGVADNARAWPQNEFLVQADGSFGPIITRNIEGKKVIDILKEIRNATFQLNITSSSNRRILFDVVPIDVSNLSTDYDSTFGWEFRTYTDLYGADRTGALEFSQENENISDPSYSINHLEEINTVYVTNGSDAITNTVVMVQDTARAGASRWNRVEEMISASSSGSGTNDQTNAGYAEVYNKRPTEELQLAFLNTPGGNGTPQSLYGIDWDLGDLLRVNFAGRQFNTEVNVVSVGVNDQGVETISGRNEVNAGQ